MRRNYDPWEERPDELAEILAKTSLRRREESREVAVAALFLASRAASFITGPTLHVDGGWAAVCRVRVGVVDRTGARRGFHLQEIPFGDLPRAEVVKRAITAARSRE